MAQPKGYVNTEYLQIVGKFVKDLKLRTYELMKIQPGQKILDVGCGPASDTIQLAQLVGQAGKVFGVDNDQAMIDEAERRAEKEGVAGWVKHKIADSGSLPFDTSDLDAVRSERLFQHLLEPERTLSEMIRVTKSGGWIVVLDTDWGSFSFDTSEVDIERRLVRVYAEKQVNNGYSGRQLYRLFHQQKLTNITVELYPLFVTNYALARQVTLFDKTEQIALTTGIVTEEEMQRWHADLEQADSHNAFFCSVTMVLVAGRKP